MIELPKTATGKIQKYVLRGGAPNLARPATAPDLLKGGAQVTRALLARSTDEVVFLAAQAAGGSAPATATTTPASASATSSQPR